MADVYLARDRLLERRVAVKVLFPEFATDLSFVARFRRGAGRGQPGAPEHRRRLRLGQQGGAYFIVMEYVNGRTLADVLRTEQKLPAARRAGGLRGRGQRSASRTATGSYTVT